MPYKKAFLTHILQEHLPLSSLDHQGELPGYPYNHSYRQRIKFLLFPGIPRPEIFF